MNNNESTKTVEEQKNLTIEAANESTEGIKEAATSTSEELLKEKKKLEEVAEALRKEKEALENEKKALADEVKKLNEREKSVSEREVAVRERENAVADTERTQTEELAKEKLDKKKALDEEISAERSAALDKISEMITTRRDEMETAFSNELEKRRAQADKDAENIRNRAHAEADRIRNEAEKEASERRKRLNAQTDAEVETRNKEIIDKEKELNKQIGIYKEKIAELEEAKQQAEDAQEAAKNAKEAADRQLRRNERHAEDIESREADLDTLVEKRYEDKIKEYNAKISEKDRALDELRNSAGELRKSVDAIESFKVSIGDEPSIIRDRISHLQKENDRLAEELANRAPAGTQGELDELKRAYGDLKQDNDNLRDENNALKEEHIKTDSLNVEKRRVEALNRELQSEIEELQGRVARYDDKIKRLSSVENRTADRDARIAEIRSGYSDGFVVTSTLYDRNEIEWLNNIGNQCDKYGISFPKRILYAFHTALKISDWSIIAVLAGVSGTGKSELPKLYAAFGGMNFISVPVQPSWDSQESMLGFYNSIDNKFEPEPMLKYLAQCTEDEKYSPYMSIVLLDEMNLAHVEHYFADFLSKLETRRGTARNVPSVEVKLGAGVEPYKLALKRTILWTGTMNQDETTKSLSDKVLDRGLVIYFPRPQTLISRTTLKNLSALIKDRQMLTEAKWTSWIIRNLITGKDVKSPLLTELDSYRKIVEDINNILEKVGRALGHRVWQSIMNYIINYPTVSEILRALGIHDEKKHTWNFDGVELTEELKANMRTAFEDQIVQKIMPKLRGIETRGKGRDYLQEIEDLLESKGFEKLKDDFEIACTQGYGQFMWSSAKYIEVDDVQVKEQSEIESEGEDKDSSEA